ncbi:bifunctional diguanylate cyclase/phosphodiesterase [Vibrio ulleungensis]|uniref:EAL domain-containing protein n=1 Tax=Vibrio ulleungensis TaxID=2807619 RepID=A0ABS2HNY1_9VIBR|nr:EAL domain-containing protein [Vibrio ulleungensis]MBM7037576.1 EAL domain-containing protein [Vibrio ulleungensis]
MHSRSLIFHSIHELNEHLEQTVIHRDADYLVQLFAACNADQAKEYSSALKSAIPNAVVVGASAQFTIAQGRTLEKQCVVHITQFDTSELFAYHAPITDDIVDTCSDIAPMYRRHKDRKALIGFADSINANDYPLFSQLTRYEPMLPISGGVSHEVDGESWVLLNQTTYQRHLVTVLLCGEQLNVERQCFTEWHPIGREFEVTEAEFGRVYSLDGQPPLHFYKKYLNQGHPVAYEVARDFPLLKNTQSGQDTFIPTSISADGSMDFIGELKQGDRVRFCYNHPSLTLNQVNGAVKQLKRFSPQALFVYNCLSRLDFMEGDEELEVFDDIEGVKAQGFFCMGEFFYTAGQHSIMHHSMTLLALSERETPLTSQSLISEQAQEKKDNLPPLFSLIKNALDDVDTMQQQMEQRLKAQSDSLLTSYRIDPRTELPNRTVLKQRLEQFTNNDHLISVKVTNFPQVNEKYGYEIGDLLLKELTAHIKQTIAQHIPNGEVSLYSLGIAEWALVFNSQMSQEKIKEYFIGLADYTEKLNFEPVGLPEMDYLSVSVRGGLVSRDNFPVDSPDELLLKSIESRRFATKNHQFIVSANELRSEERQRQEEFGWLNSVSRAVQRKNVVSYAQGVVSVETNQPAFYECLVRIEEEGKIIMPGQFLPVIEGTHLYARLSHQMIKETFRHMRNRTESFSINLSPQDMLSNRTMYLLEQEVVQLKDPSRFGVEVLETEQIKDYNRMREICDHFRAMGVRIVVDDFGSGYSNIDEIIKLEPHIIKVDGSLVRNIDRDPKQRAITEQLVNLCQVFNAKTVAEFVHNKQVADIATDMGFDFLQGFYFFEPKPTELI